MNDSVKLSGKHDKVKLSGKQHKVNELVAAAQHAGAGTDDGFWADVADQLDRAEKAKEIRVEKRLTAAR